MIYIYIIIYLYIYNIACIHYFLQYARASAEPLEREAITFCFSKLELIYTKKFLLLGVYLNMLRAIYTSYKCIA